MGPRPYGKADLMEHVVLESTGKHLYGLGSRVKDYITSRPRRKSRHVADNIFKCIFSKEKLSILILVLVWFVVKGPVDNKPALVWVIVWCQMGYKSLPEQSWLISLMHIYLSAHIKLLIVAVLWKKVMPGTSCIQIFQLLSINSEKWVLLLHRQLVRTQVCITCGCC